VKIVTIPVSLFQTNCYLIENEETKEGFLIDPGDYARVILEALEREQVKLVGIYLTHGHLDHFRAVGKLLAVYPVPVYAQSEEIAVLEDAEQNLTNFFLHKSEVLTGVEPLADGRELVVAGLSMRVIHTPGHTVGGCCYYFAQEGVLFSGDTLFCRSVGRTDFPGGSSSTLAKSIRERLYTLPEETVVYPGHGEPTDIGSEKTQNPIVPASEEFPIW